MAHGVSDISQRAYFHHEDDLDQLKTAQRSTFSPSLNNKLSNWFLSRDNGHLNRIGRTLKSLRKADLVMRSVVANGTATVQRTGVRMSGTIDRLRLRGYPMAQGMAKLDHHRKLSEIDLHAGFKKKRLEWKLKINEAAPGEMAATVEKANLSLQRSLRAKGYRPLDSLSAVALTADEPRFVRHANGHRVRLADQRFPFLARKVAQMGSRQYENGVTGLERLIKRSGQYGVVGLANGFQLLKQTAYGAAAKAMPGAGEERQTLQRHAGRARDTRRLNSAALKGNQVLADKFAQIQEEQLQRRTSSLEASGYEAAASLQGVAPAKTRYSARKMNDFFGKEGSARPAYLHKIARAYVSLLNVSDHVARHYHASRLERASKQADAPGSEQLRARHEQQRFKAQFRIDSSRAALKGQLTEVASAMPADDSASSVDDDAQ